MAACVFCGQEHPPTTITFLGLPTPVKVCPNLPSHWMLVDQRVVEVLPDDYMALPDLRFEALAIWHPTGPDTWHEHFEHGHEHPGGDRSHTHRGAIP